MLDARILVVGSFVMDLIVTTPRFPGQGETVLGSGFRTAPGGKGANQAMQAAHLGANVTMVGMVGRDSFGQELLDSLAGAGVDVSRVLISDALPSAVGNVQLEVTGGQTHNRIIVVPGANMGITPLDVAFLKETIGQYDMVILQLEIPMEINLLVAGYARAKGVPVMLNSAPYAPLPDALLQSVTYLSPNEHEAAQLTGYPLETDADICRALHDLQARGIGSVLITLGSRGVAYLSETGDMLICPAARDLPVQDPTAAGDSFVAAFCTALCAGLPIRPALELANYTAGLTCCRVGAQPSLPLLEDVLALMECQGLSTAAIRTHMTPPFERRTQPHGNAGTVC